MMKRLGLLDSTFDSIATAMQRLDGGVLDMPVMANDKIFIQM